MSAEAAQNQGKAFLWALVRANICYREPDPGASLQWDWMDHSRCGDDGYRSKSAAIARRAECD